MASLTAPLKVARVPVFALSTWSVCFDSGNGQCVKLALGTQIICWFHKKGYQRQWVCLREMVGYLLVIKYESIEVVNLELE